MPKKKETDELKYFNKMVRQRFFWDYVQSCISWVFWGLLTIMLILFVLDIIGLVDIFGF